MDLRPYQPDDREGCLAVFDSNLPEFFHPGERPDFAGFLDRPDGSYFVLDHDGVVVGCGGYAIENADLASICWLMVRHDLHRNGLGKFLLFAAMRKATAQGDPTRVRLDTTPQVAAFFEKQGFRVQEVTPDGIAPGFDRVEMVKKMKVCA
ncbi:MAG: GNAT family N-acetyltransferase [Bryobacteraceae bacterium]